MPATLGSVTTTLIEHIEAHKLHVEFESDGANHLSSPVVMEATGKVTEAANSADMDDVVGLAIMDAADAEMVTVAMRGFAIVNGEAEAATMNCGPAELGPFNGTTLLREYLVSTADAKTVGHNIKQGVADGDPVKIVLL